MLKLGENYEGFKLINKKKLNEINLIIYIFKHNKTKGEVTYIKSKGIDKCFSVSFKTHPENNKGALHVLEHCILCGSEKYKFRNLFKDINKYTVASKMNAFVGKNLTKYYFSTRNMVDFDNLMDIYLNSVFFPRAIKEKNIFKKEGIRYELDENENLKYNGIVYNEIKSKKINLLNTMYKTSNEILFPETPYAYMEGGSVEGLRDLKYEDIKKAHEKYYIPQNCQVYLYGEFDIKKKLKYINENYFGKFEKIKEKDKKIYNFLFNNMRYSQKTYIPLQKRKDNYHVQFSYVIDYKNSKDMQKIIFLNMLFKNKGIDIEKGLEKYKLFKSMKTSLDISNKMVLRFSFLNIDKKNILKLKALFYRELRDISINGINKESVEAFDNFIKTSFKEMNFNNHLKGLVFSSVVTTRFRNDSEYFSGFFSSQSYDEILNDMNYEKIISKEILNNNHSAMLVFVPDYNKQKRILDKEQQELIEFKNKLSEKDFLNLKNEIDNFKKWNENFKEVELDNISQIKKEDLNKKFKFNNLKKVKVGDIDILRNKINLNDLAYIKFSFDFSHLEEEEKRYAILLSRFLNNADTNLIDSSNIEKEIFLNTGGLQSNVLVETHLKKDDVVQKFNIEGTILKDKEVNFFNIVNLLMQNAVIKNENKIKKVIEQDIYNYENHINNDPMSFLINRSSEFYDITERKKQHLFGYDYYKFLKKLNNEFETNEVKIVKNLKNVYKNLFYQNNLTVFINSNDEMFEILKGFIKKESDNLIKKELEKKDFDIDLIKEKEAYALPVDLNYNLRVKRVDKKIGGISNLIKRIIDKEFLTSKLREEQGVYGAYVFKFKGDFIFASYNDPNIEKTYKIFDQVDSFLKEYEIDQEKLDKYIVKEIMSLPRYNSEKTKGNIAYSNFLCGYSKEYKEKIIKEILEATPKKIKEAMKDIINSKETYDLTLGNKELLERDIKLFDKIIEIFEI